VWENLAATTASIGMWAGYVLWVILLVVACASILITLPGGWIALGLAVLYDLLHGFDRIGWVILAVFAGLLIVGEIVESLLGILYVARKGATRYGVIGGFVGGIVGAIAGSGIMPLVGTLLGGAAGAFGGSVLGEYLRDQRLEPSLRIGWHATVGRLLATSMKFALALSGSLLAARAALD
jgi:uncharacterized protein YqgC (DUF456 family)